MSVWTISRWLALGSMLVITILSTLPGDLRPHTGQSGNIEHFIAYFGAAGLIQLGLPRLRRWREVVLLSLAAAVFEILQNWIPGRSPGVDNWAASTGGAIAGMVIGLVVLRLVKARFPEADQ